MPASFTFRSLGIHWQFAPNHRSDTWVFVSYWMFASPIILSSFGVTSFWMMVGYFSYMVVAYTASAWFIINVLFPSYMPSKRYVLGFISLLLTMFVCAVGNQLIDSALLGDSNSFWVSVFKFELPNDAQNILTIVAILAGKKYFDERQRTTELESERRQSELSRLRAQVDPHFLFNSLNILDILIEDNPSEARHFVHRLSNLYRYLIRHRDEDLVPAADELLYAQDYGYLVKRRFGDAFNIRVDVTADELEGTYLPPGALQTVLENVFKHNAATASQPIEVGISRRDDMLLVRNKYRPKQGQASIASRRGARTDGEGSGINNLLKRFSMLSHQKAYSRRTGDLWEAGLPLVQNVTPGDRSASPNSYDSPNSLPSNDQQLAHS